MHFTVMGSFPLEAKMFLLVKFSQNVSNILRYHDSVTNCS